MAQYYLQQLVNGICLGGMYALMSVGYSLVYSIMNFSNFAHGGVIMVGAYVGYFALTALHVPFLVAFLLCGLGSGTLAIIIERLVYSPIPDLVVSKHLTFQDLNALALYKKFPHDSSPAFH
ncbi:MAG: hypothetical protein II111_06455, partial [Oscillospiraceae bacterium]|nr:hypothetical protein [Oscillospiraceae bacterium]